MATVQIGLPVATGKGSNWRKQAVFAELSQDRRRILSQGRENRFEGPLIIQLLSRQSSERSTVPKCKPQCKSRRRVWRR
jgi:hypothetical protein